MAFASLKKSFKKLKAGSKKKPGTKPKDVEPGGVAAKRTGLENLQADGVPAVQSSGSQTDSAMSTDSNQQQKVADAVKQKLVNLDELNVVPSSTREAEHGGGMELILGDQPVQPVPVTPDPASPSGGGTVQQTSDPVLSTGVAADEYDHPAYDMRTPTKSNLSSSVRADQQDAGCSARVHLITPDSEKTGESQTPFDEKKDRQKDSSSAAETANSVVPTTVYTNEDAASPSIRERDIETHVDSSSSNNNNNNDGGGDDDHDHDDNRNDESSADPSVDKNHYSGNAKDLDDSDDESKTENGDTTGDSIGATVLADELAKMAQSQPHRHKPGKLNPEQVSKRLLAAFTCQTDSTSTDEQAAANRDLPILSNACTSERMQHGCGGGAARSTAADDLGEDGDAMIYSDQYATRFLDEILNVGIPMIYHHQQDEDDADSEWVGRSVTMVFRPGMVTGLHIEQPRLEWSSMGGGRSNEILTKSISLLSIHSITSSMTDPSRDDVLDDGDDSHIDDGDDSHIDDGDEPLCFCTLTSDDGDVHLFESITPEQSERLVNGIKNLCLRYSKLILSRDRHVLSEFYNSNTVEAPGSKLEPDLALLRVCHAFMNY